MNRIKRGINKLKWPVQDLFYFVALKRLRLESNQRRILVYHGIVPNANTGINARFISSEHFEQQIQFFKEHFNVVSLDQYFDGVSHPEKLTIALTFDDGYLNNLQTALPILEKYQVHATFFITTIRNVGYEYLWADLIDLYRFTGPSRFEFQGKSYLKKKHEYVSAHGSLKSTLKGSDWSMKKAICDFILNENDFIQREELFPYFQLMNEAHIQQLSQSPYAAIGSHALYHNCLTKISLEEAEIELKKSKEYLENITQQEVNSLAYPDGDYSAQLIDLAQKVGYKMQLLVDYNQADEEADPRLESRFGINPYISFKNQIQSIINGRY